MRLDKIEISGFKSFKDKTVIEFPDKFMAIVGPNGSGKSNIVDAICFVMGKSRGLRAQKLTELIFNGGVKGKPSKRAVISMYLSDGERKMRLSRKIDDRMSAYYLNNQRVTREKIVELVGDSEYNVIFQADVTKVIEMRPVDRRGVIDDLCGIGEYDRKKERALLELEKVEDKISETGIVLGEKKNYLRMLKRERDDALMYRKVEEELRVAKAGMLGKTMASYNKNIERVNRDIKVAEDERNNLENKIAEVKKKVSDKYSGIKELHNKISELEKKKGADEITEHKVSIAGKEEYLKNLDERLDRIKNEVFTSTDRKVKLNTDLHMVDSELKKVSDELKGLEEKINAEEKKIEDMGVLNLEEKIDELKDKIHVTKSQLNTKVELKRKLLAERDNLRSKKESLGSGMKDMLFEETKIARELDTLESEHGSAFKEISSLSNVISGLDRKIEILDKKMDDLRIKATEKKAELKTLEKTDSKIRTEKVVNEVMKLKDFVEGIHGPAIQLGTITNPEYEIPLSIAGGKRLNNIVVENENIAGKCIDYLKKKKIGRATFLPLNKLKVNISNSPPDDSLGFARDFVEANKKFKDVFDYIFKNTLVVNDINTGKKIGVGKWRMVTLDGDLMELSGAMTGGYVDKKRIGLRWGGDTRIGTSIGDEIKRIEGKINELGKDLQALLQQKKIKQSRLDVLKQSAGDDRAEIERLKEKKVSLNERREELKLHISEINTGIEVSEDDISGMGSDIKTLQHDLGVYEKKADKLMKKREDVNLDYMGELKDKKRDIDISHGKLNEKGQSLKSQVSELEEKLEELFKEKKHLTEDKKKISSELEKLKKELGTLEEEHKDTADEIETYMGQKNNAESEIMNLNTHKDELASELEEVRERESMLMVRKAKIETQIDDLREEFEQYSASEFVSMPLAKLKEKVSDLEEKLDGFGVVNLKAIENYDILNNEVGGIEEKLDTLKEEKESIFDLMDKIEKRKKEVFMDCHVRVKENFEEIFAELSSGKGTLVLSDPEDISNSGLLIEASPGGKKLLHLDAMSGGEKVLTSAAFLLAIQRYKPSVFYVVDELDAALDRKNSMRLARMLRDSGAQFILVTHNEEIMKYAKAVVGVAMSDGISQVVGTRFEGLSSN